MYSYSKSNTPDTTYSENYIKTLITLAPLLIIEGGPPSDQPWTSEPTGDGWSTANSTTPKSNGSSTLTAGQSSGSGGTRTVPGRSGTGTIPTENAPTSWKSPVQRSRINGSRPAQTAVPTTRNSCAPPKSQRPSQYTSAGQRRRIPQNAKFRSQNPLRPAIYIPNRGPQTLFFCGFSSRLLNTLSTLSTALLSDLSESLRWVLNQFQVHPGPTLYPETNPLRNKIN